MNDKRQYIIYEKSENNKCRYALGVKGNNPLIFLGINPSTATPDDYDQTMKKAKGFALKNNFDSWIMLNIYPQRATNPDNLDEKLNVKFHKDNIKIIKKYIKNNATVVAAWGNPINKRDYLLKCLQGIVKELKSKQMKWSRIGKLTKSGNPWHISRLGYDEKIVRFDIDDYLSKKQGYNHG